MSKNLLKIWPKLIELDKQHHIQAGREVELSLAEWISKHSREILGRKIEEGAVPLMSMDELIHFLESHTKAVRPENRTIKMWSVFMLHHAKGMINDQT